MALPFKHIPDICPAYLVGGTVRDMLLSRAPTDYDIAVAGNPEDFARNLAAANKGRVVVLGKPGLLLFRVVIPGHLVDITGLNGDCIEADLGERDFTINAMAIDLADGNMIDLFNVRRDIERRIVRMVSPTAFLKDPVRLIRAFRMAAAFSFAISRETARAIATHAGRIRTSAAERIRDELFKILECDPSVSIVRQMEEIGLLEEMFPELYSFRKPLRLPFDAYGNLEQILHAPESRFPQWASEIRRDVGKTERGLLKCACLFQDVGAMNNAPEGSSSTRESNAQAAVADGIASRLKFSNHRKLFIDTVIRYAPLTRRLCRSELTRREHMRFYTRFDAFVPAMMLLESSMNEIPDAVIDGQFQEFYGYYRATAGMPRLISGRDLIRDLGLDPSPAFKLILSMVEEERLLGNLTTREEALEFIKQWLADDEDG